MGCDIYIVAQKKNDEGKWEDVEGNFCDGPNPFDWRSYGIFGFLADVYNWSAIPPISKPRGFPDDFPNELKDCFGDFAYSWLSVEELVNYDYDQIIEDRRTAVQTGPNSWNGGKTCKEGEGEKQTLRAFLLEGFFDDLKELQNIGAERIVFGFNN